jgi:hypothetical protein
MKFEEIYLSILAEQPGPPDDHIWDEEGNLLDADGNIIGPADDENDGPEVPEEPEAGVQDDPIGLNLNAPKQEKPANAPKKPKPLSEVEKIKMKWREESPGLTDVDMQNVIDFFNGRKNGLREYKDPASNPEYINLPEVTALVVRFPNMMPVLSNHQKIRDIQNYTWEEMEFYMDRAGTAMAAAEMDYSIAGDTPEIRLANAYKKWESPIGLLFDENNIRVYKITGKDESIALGRLQHILVSKYGGANWCITNAPGMGASNLYTSYRDRRSYYFVLDKNKSVDDPWYLSTIEPVDMNGRQNYEGPFAMTPRPNGTNTGKSWEDVLAKHPQLDRNKKGLFVYFGTTVKEKTEVKLDQITFRQGDRNDFATQKLDIQKRYIESGRLINDKRAFSVLPYDKANNLRKDYIARTTLNDYKTRFKCNDTSDPFGILNIIQRDTPGLFRFLDEVVLQTQLHLPNGVRGIKIGIIGISYNPVFTDYQDKNIILFKEIRGNGYGVLDLETPTGIEWIKPMGYIATATKVLIKRDQQGGVKTYLLQRYSNNNNDYFYFLLNQAQYLNKTSPNYAKGKYLTKEDIQELLESGEYRELGYGKK